MKILLLQPRMNWLPKHAEAPSTALLILGTLAKQRNHKVKVMHLDIDGDLPVVTEVLENFQPDIIGMTVNTFQVKSAKEVSKLVKERGLRLLVGGPHAQVWDSYADDIIVGEGEGRWLEIIGDGQPNSIDDIFPMDYSLVNLMRFTGISPRVGATPSACIMASRGCPFDCIFCDTPLNWGKKVRFHNPEIIVSEVERLNKDYGVKEIFFQDDTFNLNHKWAFSIFEGIIKKGLNKKMLFRLTGRVNEKLVTKEYLDLAFKAGVWNIFYGIESGSQYMLDRMKKGTTVEEIKRAIRMTHEAHIASLCSFIVGLPGESWDTLKETASLIDEIKPTYHGWSHACPFPNTEFEKEVKAKGHMRKLPFEDYAYGLPMVRTDKLSFEELASFGGFQ